MIFTEPQQKKHRTAFIEECRQKAWGAHCHADWISKNLEELLANYQNLQAEARELEVKIDELAKAPDYHTVDNREKRKEMEKRGTAIAAQMKRLFESAQEGQKAISQLIQSAENSLALAKHAEGRGGVFRSKSNPACEVPSTRRRHTATALPNALTIPGVQYEP
jgi:hypothetical protein